MTPHGFITGLRDLPQVTLPVNVGVNLSLVSVPAFLTIPGLVPKRMAVNPQKEEHLHSKDLPMA